MLFYSLKPQLSNALYFITCPAVLAEIQWKQKEAGRVRRRTLEGEDVWDFRTIRRRHFTQLYQIDSNESRRGKKKIKTTLGISRKFTHAANDTSPVPVSKPSMSVAWNWHIWKSRSAGIRIAIVHLKRTRCAWDSLDTRPRPGGRGALGWGYWSCSSF